MDLVNQQNSRFSDELRGNFHNDLNEIDADNQQQVIDDLKDEIRILQKNN